MKLHDAYARGGAILATAGLLFGSAPAWADEPDPALTADTVKVSASRVDKERDHKGTDRAFSGAYRR